MRVSTCKMSSRKRKKEGNRLPVPNGEEARPMGGSEYQELEGNIRGALSQDFRGGVPNCLVDNVYVIIVDVDSIE